MVENVGIVGIAVGNASSFSSKVISTSGFMVKFFLFPMLDRVGGAISKSGTVENVAGCIFNFQCTKHDQKQLICWTTNKCSLKASKIKILYWIHITLFQQDCLTLLQIPTVFLVYVHALLSVKYVIFIVLFLLLYWIPDN